MKNLKQKILMTLGILLTFGLVAAARPALPSNAPEILRGEAMVQVAQAQELDDDSFFEELVGERPLRRSPFRLNRFGDRLRR